MTSSKREKEKEKRSNALPLCATMFFDSLAPEIASAAAIANFRFRHDPRSNQRRRRASSSSFLSSFVARKENENVARETRGTEPQNPVFSCYSSPLIERSAVYLSWLSFSRDLSENIAFRYIKITDNVEDKFNLNAEINRNFDILFLGSLI